MKSKAKGRVSLSPCFLFQAFQRSIQNRLPFGKIHIGHIEGFQLVVQFLGLRERGACAMQMELNPGAALFQRALVAQQRAPRDTGGKVEGLFGGELFARGAGGRVRWGRGVLPCCIRPRARRR